MRIFRYTVVTRSFIILLIATAFAAPKKTLWHY